MSSNILPPRSPRKRKLSAAPTMPPEPIQQPKKPRKTNMGNAMRSKNRRVSAPFV